MNTETSQAWINTQIGFSWLDMEYHVAWHGGYVLDQVVARREDYGWLIVLKATRGKTAYASFTEARTLTEAYELVAEFAERGVLTWQRDKWPSRRVKRFLGLF